MTERERNITDTIAYLDHLKIKYASFGELRTANAFLNNGEVACSKWRDWWDTPRCDRFRTNLRAVLPDEVVLDIDAENAQARTAKLKRILACLGEQRYSYEIWFTGSRGHHIHLLFPEMLSLQAEERVNVRKWFIRLYDADIAKQSGVIALEGAKHFKTGQPKELFLSKKTAEPNVLPAECKEFVKKIAARVEAFRLRKQTQPATYGRRAGKVSKNQLKKRFYANPLVQYSLEAIVPDGTQRHNTLVRWLAQECLKAELLDSEIEEFAKKASPNFPNKNFSADLTGWLEWLRKKAMLEERAEKVEA